MKKTDQEFQKLVTAAEGGDPDAQLKLGHIYYFADPEPVPGFFGKLLGRADSSDPDLVYQDYEQAYRWFLEAAESGNADAQLQVGFMLDEGVGTSKDEKGAIDWYRRAADQGNVKAILNVGLSYQFGTGVQKDYQEAARWLRRAAEKGDPKAKQNLEQMEDMGVIESEKISFAESVRNLFGGGPVAEADGGAAGAAEADSADGSGDGAAAADDGAAGASEEDGAGSVIPVQALMDLKQLLDAGVITQEDFDQKKKQLLGL